MTQQPSTQGRDGVVPALHLRSLSKTFPGTRALREVSFDVPRAGVHALLGGNGSGKSTLIKILAGVHTADAGGRIGIGAQEFDADSLTPSIARQHGLRFVHQDPGLFVNLSVAENFAMGAGFPTRGAQISWRALTRRSASLLERYRIAARPDTLLGDLSPAMRSMVAIARALQDDEAANDAVLVLDEPTASLPAAEVDVLFEAVRGYVAHGHTIVFVSHRIDEVLALADSVTVLRDGQHVISCARQDVDESSLIEHIVGRRLDRVYPALSSPVESQDAVLTVSGLAGGPLKDVSLTVGRGEVVGIAGLLGSGRTELLRMIFGAMPRERGTLAMEGREVSPAAAADGMALGMAYIPEDRAADAAFADMSVRDNISIVQTRKYFRGLRMRSGRESRDAREAIAEFLIRSPSDTTLLSSLSGGNQQKVILARWLSRAPRLLLLDEPTQGIDVGARADAYALVRAQVADGMAALLVSSDFEELSRACDRVLVLADGRVVAEVRAPDLDSDRLTELVYLGGRAA